MVVLVGSDLSDVPEDVVRVVCGGQPATVVTWWRRYSWHPNAKSPTGASAMRTLGLRLTLVQVRGPEAARRPGGCASRGHADGRRRAPAGEGNRGARMTEKIRNSST